MKATVKNLPLWCLISDSELDDAIEKLRARCDDHTKRNPGRSWNLENLTDDECAWMLATAERVRRKNR